VLLLGKQIDAQRSAPASIDDWWRLWFQTLVRNIATWADGETSVVCLIMSSKRMCSAMIKDVEDEDFI